ncbi:MAG: response regulator [Marinosulfonomonas sp.]|nr:response regulator [Marinosulfonomonas sp.]
MDDDEAVRDSLSVMLSLAGLRVQTCTSGEELLVLLKDSTPDCLVIDVHMPGMNGLELIERLNDAGVGIPVVLISGNMDDATEKLARRLGVTHLLRKPVPGATLIKIVKGIVG